MTELADLDLTDPDAPRSFSERAGPSFFLATGFFCFSWAAGHATREHATAAFLVSAVGLGCLRMWHLLQEIDRAKTAMAHLEMLMVVSKNVEPEGTSTES